MSDIRRKFDTNVASTQLTNITSEQFFSVIPNMSQKQGCVVQIEVDPAVSPTDDAIVKVYARQNGTDFDIVPFMTLTVDKDDDPSRLTFVVEKLFEFRVGIARSGSTDTILSADMDTRLYTWEVV